MIKELEEDVWPVTEEEERANRESFQRLPPHKRNLKSLYRAWFWRL